jgi:hypothetical protein
VFSQYLCTDPDRRSEIGGCPSLHLKAAASLIQDIRIQYLFDIINMFYYTDWNTRMLFPKHTSRYFFSLKGVCAVRYFLLLLILVPANTQWAQEFSADDAPGLLSPSHAETVGIINCMKCHNDDFEVPPEKCLSCHEEIMQRIKNERGYHQDKGEDCIICHTEHQGDETILINLAPEDFDHEETGAVLEGSHREIKDCRKCHRKDNTFPREKSISYLLKETGCLACHISPHPGSQDLCLKCHTQNNWRFGSLIKRRPG